VVQIPIVGRGRQAGALRAWAPSSQLLGLLKLAPRDAPAGACSAGSASRLDHGIAP